MKDGAAGAAGGDGVAAGVVAVGILLAKAAAERRTV